MICFLDTLFLHYHHLQVSGKAFEKNFTDIMKHYRNQPQATSHVYRSVLLAGKAAVTSPQVELSPYSQMSGSVLLDIDTNTVT